MQKHLSILLAGIVVVAPLGATVWVVYAVGSWLNHVGETLLRSQLGDQATIWPGVGIAVVIVAVYLVGLLTHLWIFSRLLDWLDRLISHVPGIKTIYQSVRDLLKLFGRGSDRMGRVVRYNVPGTEMSTLGVLTNERPEGQNKHSDTVAVYMPFSYILGGITVFVERDRLEDVDMPVEQALKLCATGHVTGTVEKSEHLSARQMTEMPEQDGGGNGN